MAENENVVQGNFDSDDKPGGETNAPAKNPGSTIPPLAVAVLPFAPLAMSGPQAPWAFGRIALYGVASALTFKRFRTASYVLMSAAALSAATSLSATAMNGGK